MLAWPFRVVVLVNLHVSAHMLLLQDLVKLLAWSFRVVVACQCIHVASAGVGDWLD